MASSPAVRLSVIVPCYNTEAFLPRCLDSLIAQTLGGIEVVCVNDGSPDGSLAVLRRYESARPDLIRVIDQPNGGIWSARLAGTEAARGAYVAYVDSDDYVEPSFAADLYETAEREGAEIVVCGFRRFEGATGQTLSRELGDPRPSFDPHAEPGRILEVNPAVWNKCFRRSLIGRMRRLENPPEILEDVAMSMLTYLASSGTVAFTGTTPYNYQVRPGSLINSVTVRQVEGVKRALVEVREAFGQEGASPEMIEALDAAAFLHLGVSMPFRLSCDPAVGLRGVIDDATGYLDGHFPTWRRSHYLGVGYAARHGSAYRKLAVARAFYRTHLMRPFLAAYRLYVSRSGRDLKW